MLVRSLKRKCYVATYTEMPNGNDCKAEIREHAYVRNKTIFHFCLLSLKQLLAGQTVSKSPGTSYQIEIHFSVVNLL